MFDFLLIFLLLSGHKYAIMKKWVFFNIFIILVSCKGKTSETYLTPEKATGYFKSIEEICNRDSGKLWGKNLYAPVMFVERVTRRITANKPDNEGILKSKDEVYTGVSKRTYIKQCSCDIWRNPICNGSNTP